MFITFFWEVFQLIVLTGKEKTRGQNVWIAARRRPIMSFFVALQA